MSCNGLAEVRVLLIPSIAGDKGMTRFILQDLVNGQTLIDRSIVNDQITAEDWYSFEFDPNWDSSGQRFILTLQGMRTPPVQGLKLLYTTQAEFDLGDLHENEQLMQEDIVLQYGCVTGLRKLWLTGEP